MDNEQLYIEKIILSMKEMMQPGWDKMMLHCQMGSNFLSYTLPVQSNNKLKAECNISESFKEQINNLWNFYVLNISTLSWNEFVIILDKNRDEIIDYYYKEMEYLHSYQKTQFFESKYLGIELDEKIKNRIKNPHITNKIRKYNYKTEESKEYKLLFEKLESQSINELWKIYLDCLKSNRPNLKIHEVAGCKTSDIEEFEIKIGTNLPEDFKSLLLINNIKFSHFCFCFMPFNKIQSEWQMHDYILQKNSPDAMILMNENFISYPEKTIKEVCANRLWIPFYEDHGGNFLGIDLDPDINGNRGQIINFGRDEHEMFVISESFREFLILLIYINKYLQVKKQSSFIKSLKRIFSRENPIESESLDNCFLGWLHSRYLIKKEG